MSRPMHKVNEDSVRPQFCKVPQSVRTLYVQHHKLVQVNELRIESGYTFSDFSVPRDYYYQN
jgi:hypothetical protein